jgi:succinate dehydrogenase / fumarate reductase cytochrome b subunit
MSVSNRPKYLNLMKIRLPIPGLVSILHRISGFGMFLFAWGMLWLLQMVLQSPETFAQVQACADSWIVKVFLTGMAWAFLHHFFAGIRFLLLDVHIGTELETTRRMSWLVIALSIVGTLIVGAKIWSIV